MPLNADPSATCALPLDGQADRKLICRFITRQERQRVDRLCEQAFDEKDDATCFDLLWQAITVGIVGWKGFDGEDGKPLEFNADNLSRFFSDNQIWRLARTYPTQVSMQEGERKLFRSPSPAADGNSAPDADSTATAPVAA